MRKRVSFLLVLSMILAIVVPVAGYAEKEVERVYLDQENFTRTEEDEKVIISIKEGDLVKALESFKGEAEGPREVLVDLGEEEGFNIDLVLTGGAMNALKEAGAGLKLEGRVTSISLPAGALGPIGFESRETIKLKMDKWENREAAQVVRDYDAMKRAFNIYIERDRKINLIEIYRLEKPLEIEFKVESIGNPDLLSVYRLEDGEMDFITGKVRDGRMSFQIEDLGRHGLVETYFNYTDTKNHWARTEIKSMSSKNVIDGVGEGLFKPDDSVTRAEFAKMLVASLEVELVDYDGSFKDVEKTDWFAPYVATAYERGIIKGKTQDKFKPEDKITREEMAAMLSRLDPDQLSESQVEKELDQYEDREEISDWALADLAKVSKKGIMTGKKDGLDPKAKATRAEAATMMARVYTIY